MGQIFTESTIIYLILRVTSSSVISVQRIDVINQMFAWYYSPLFITMCLVLLIEGHRGTRTACSQGRTSGVQCMLHQFAHWTASEAAHYRSVVQLVIDGQQRISEGHQSSFFMTFSVWHDMTWPEFDVHRLCVFLTELFCQSVSVYQVQLFTL